MPNKMKVLPKISSRNIKGEFGTALKTLLLLFSIVVGILFVPPKAIGALDVQVVALSRNPDIIKSYRLGSYDNPEAGIYQIHVNSSDRDGGAVAASWSLEELNLSDAESVKLTFDLLTNVTKPGNFGPRVGASVGLATSNANCCPSDRSAILSKDAKVASVGVDCCYAGANLFFDARLWTNPKAPDSGDRTTKIFSQQFSGYAADATFHSYTIEMNLTSQTTKWAVDGGAATASYPGFNFAPSHVIFSAEGHDTGDYSIAQLRSPRITISRAETSGTASNNAPPASPFLQWWFWAIAGLATTSGALLFINVRSRSQSKTTGHVVAQNIGSTCPQCGERMPPNSMFCGKCGHKLEGQENEATK